MDINKYYDKIFIINLEKRKDRWKDILLNLDKFKITNYERFNACYVDNLHDEDPNNYKNFRENGVKKHGKKYINGALGCKKSHLEIIKLAKTRKYKKILILEDDIIIRDIFSQKMSIVQKEIEELGENFDIILFTGNHQKLPKKSTEHLYKISETYATMAYTINHKLYDYILNTAISSGLEIDVYYTKFVYNKQNSYCVIPHIFGHVGGYSDISNKDRGVFKCF